ncbi:MAG TPA: hypothetical protein VFL59_06615 [Candidatus Nanopelagicales bacterium]|nr:hypothetical protein [Candidatus Nanopelagicales bacterium]
MSRTTRRRAIRAVAPVAGLLAAGLLVWQGSYAAFSATSTNQSDAWATGQLVLKNNGVAGSFLGTTTTPLINASNIAPGATSFTRCITVESSGTIAGALKFYRGAVSDTNVANPGSNLSSAISVTVDAAAVGAAAVVDPTCAAAGPNIAFPGGSTNVVPTTTLAGLPASYAAAGTSMAVAAGTQRVAYRFTWSFPSTASDNLFQNASTQADLNWEIR